MSSSVKERNSTVDILRGIAMLMVILGHTMTGCTENSQDTLLFNIVWTLQMPLFILISGYVTKYSRRVSRVSGLWKYIGRKTLSYLLPWAVWSFLIRGVIFGQTLYLNVGWLLYHMDSGYWFLFTLWMIVIIFGVAEFTGRKLNRRGNLYFGIITTGVVYVIGMVLLVGIGLVIGLDFLDIKLTLYYMPFYFAGYMYGQLEEKLSQMKFGESAKEAAIAVCLLLWFYLMNRYNFYSIGDSGFGIIIRATASVAGCIAICGLVSNLCSLKLSAENAGGGYSATACRGTFPGDLSDSLSCPVVSEAGDTTCAANSARCTADGIELCFDNRSGDWSRGVDKPESVPSVSPVWQKALRWVGVHSLEIYVIHGLCLNLLKLSVTPEFETAMGVVLVLGNYVLTVALTCLVALLIGQNGIIQRIALGKAK